MEPATACKPPPALYLVRARSRATRVADLHAAAWPGGPPDTPPRRSPVTVPFLWEEAPGKPKAPPPGPDLPVDDGERDQGIRGVRAVPLKLPPRLQHAAAAAGGASLQSSSSSPRNVLYGCAGGGGRPHGRRIRSGAAAAFRRTPSAGVGLFSRTRSKPTSAAGPDAPWSSPAASSSSASSSSSSSSMSAATCPAADGSDHYSEDEDSNAAGSVRITRFRRNRSLPSMSTAHLWASIRWSVKQITTPWS